MKSQSTQRLLSLAVLLFALVMGLQAQNANQIVLVKKIIHEDGTETVIKKSVSSDEDLEKVLPQFKEGHSEYFSIEFKGEDKGKEPTAFLGVYPSDNPEGEGVMLDEIIANTGAAAAGLHNGDVLVSIDGQALQSEHSLHQVLTTRQPNDQIRIVYIRNGQSLETVATLSSRRTDSFQKLERDPCQVFIGVMISGQGSEGKGAYVSGVIPKTPAETAGMQAGDVILAIDDVETNTHEAVLVERNKHQPGEWFSMSVLRSGEVIEVEAQFQTCDPQKPAETLADPSAETLADPSAEASAQADPVLQTDYTLQLHDYSAFPNPTYGELNISFKADAKPSVVRISDASGRVIFEENLPKFDGYYARQLDLQNATPGLLLLSIQQEDRVINKKLVLLAKA
ncbi:MAG: PDZ domain-containing protein [Saprospirales bacterium]|nr:PDZ domain-containing protein [Saprospirales bacterium]